MRIKEKIISSVLEDLDKDFKTSQSALTSEQSNDFEALKTNVKKSLEKQLSPLIDEAIIPILLELDKLSKAVTKMDSAISTGLTGVGAGAAAVGAAGATAYKGASPIKDLTKLNKELTKLKREL